MPDDPLKHKDVPTYAVVFAGWEGKDWMARVDKHPEGFAVHHRLRIHNPIPRGDHVWDEQDRKLWSHHGPFPTFEAALQMATKALILASMMFGFPELVDEVIEPTGDQERFIAEMEKKPWVFTKKFKTEAEASAFLKGREPS